MERTLAQRLRHLAIPVFAALASAACDRATSIGAPVVTTLVGCPSLPTPPARGDRPGGVAHGPFPAHLNAAWEEGAEIIEARWLPVSAFPGFLHEVVVYTNARGDQSVIAGFPDVDFSWTFDVGTIVMAGGKYDPFVSKPFAEDLGKGSARMIVATGPDLSALWADMEQVAEIIDRLGVEYDLAGRNSNSAAETVLKYAGFPSTDDRLWGDAGAGVDVIAYAKNHGGGICDDADDEVSRAER